MMQLGFFVPGQPFPEPRARAVGLGGRRARVVADRRADPWKAAVRAAAESAARQLNLGLPVWKAGEPVIFSCRFFLERPKTVTRDWPIAAERNDLDNLLKGTLDALGPWRKLHPIAWCDDAQVVGFGECWKLYAPAGRPTGAEIIIQPAPHPTEV